MYEYFTTLERSKHYYNISPEPKAENIYHQLKLGSFLDLRSVLQFQTWFLV